MESFSKAIQFVNQWTTGTTPYSRCSFATIQSSNSSINTSFDVPDSELDVDYLNLPPMTSSQSISMNTDGPQIPHERCKLKYVHRQQSQNSLVFVDLSDPRIMDIVNRSSIDIPQLPHPPQQTNMTSRSIRTLRQWISTTSEAVTHPKRFRREQNRHKQRRAFLDSPVQFEESISENTEDDEVYRKMSQMTAQLPYPPCKNRKRRPLNKFRSFFCRYFTCI